MYNCARINNNNIITHNHANRSLYYNVLLMMAKVFQLDGIFTGASENEASGNDEEMKRGKYCNFFRIFSPPFRCPFTSLAKVGAGRRKYWLRGMARRTNIANQFHFMPFWFSLSSALSLR